MATDTDHHPSYYNNWSRPDCVPLDSQHSQEVSISELIGHGSISFGRFATESLAWEKWSVFSHNRCQEELEKFKAPGLVAQKKAFFEEYYRKIRALKKLQAEQQETNPSDPCQEEQNTTTQAENIVEIAKPNEEKKHGDADKIIISETGTIIDQDSSGVISRDKLAAAQINISSSTIEPEHFANKAAPKPAPSIKKCSKTSQQDNLVPDTVKPSANKPKDYAPSKDKGSVASARNKSKSDCRTKKDVKPAEKPKPFFDRDITGKTDNSLVSSKRIAPKVASNIKSNTVSSHRPFTEVHSSVTVMHHSVLKDKLASCSSSMGGGLTRANPSSKGSVNKSTSKEITNTGSVGNTDLSKRTCARTNGKSIELSSHRMIPKRGQSDDQKPKSMSANLPALSKSNQNFGNEFGRRNFVRGKQKEVTNAGLGRVPKPASSMLSAIPKAPNWKLEHEKVVSWQCVDLTHVRRDPRHKKPSWR
ncbi:hypothetical protein F0562_035112 [Nyssa sinensis]|uniref:TPX2 C-terminal domain-containing protein n=1 Tax=Nyssa sinensis TaxID=561372 RepID=A0A5J5ACS4_9ASTE|nr:hypothetical protein F0562_035112 [Nyssa sinensis]